MTTFLAVSNRRGGVGKTTVTTMLAYALAVRAHQRVLVIDLDAQASTSIVLMGYQRWSNARDEGLTVGDFLVGAIANEAVGALFEAPEFIHTAVGDVRMADGSRPAIDMIPCSHELDDREEEILVISTARRSDVKLFFQDFRDRVAELIRSVDGQYDTVLIDCAPGLSNVVWGALRAADRVLIPFFPDRTAEDNVGWLIARLAQLGKTADQVRILPNRVSGRSSIAPAVIEAMGARFPQLGPYMPASEAIAGALDFYDQPVTYAQKFGDTAIPDALMEAVVAWVRGHA